MNILTWVVAYLSGVILAYIILKKQLNTGLWTKGDRAQTLFLAAFSWISVLVGVVKYFNEYENDKPAKW